MLRVVLVTLLSLCLIGCATMKAVERPTPSTPNQLIVGDDVRVTTKTGKTYELEITAVAETSITGRETTGKLWRVPFEQIQTLEVEEISTGKTVGLSLGVTVLLAVVAIVITGYALGKALDDKSGND